MDSELSQALYDAINKRNPGTPGIHFIQINKQTYNLHSTAPVEGLIKMFRDCVRVYRNRNKIKKGRNLNGKDYGLPSLKDNNVSPEALQIIAETMNSMTRQSRKASPNGLFCQPNKFIQRELSHAQLNHDAICAFERLYDHGDEFNVKSRSRTGTHDMGNQSQRAKFVGTVKNAVILQPVGCQDCHLKKITPCKHMIPYIYNDNKDMVSRRVYIPKELQRASEHDVALPPRSYSKKKTSRT